MKIAVLVEDNYQVLELWYPYYRLREENIETVIVGTGKEKSSYHSKEGYPAKEEMSIEHLNPNEFDGVIIPGGYAPDKLRTNEKVKSFVSHLHKQGKLVAAICHGGWVLVSADILKGKRATCYYAIKDDISNAGAEYVDDQCVVDKNLITSRTPNDLPVFCKEIVKFLTKVKAAV